MVNGCKFEISVFFNKVLWQNLETKTHLPDRYQRIASVSYGIPSEAGSFDSKTLSPHTML